LILENTKESLKQMCNSSLSIHYMRVKKKLPMHFHIAVWMTQPTMSFIIAPISKATLPAGLVVEPGVRKARFWDQSIFSEEGMFS
jgi:hypothetical protein